MLIYVIKREYEIVRSLNYYYNNTQMYYCYENIIVISIVHFPWHRIMSKQLGQTKCHV